ncbi:MAG: hypothetical protein ACE5GS_03740 [Kiloniellaceae bacterium]
MAEQTKCEERKGSVQTRRCLLCGGEFPSEGPHNRICRKCKSSQVWRQG